MAASGTPKSFGHLLIYIHSGKHLPKMDPLLGKIDPYLVVKIVDPGNPSTAKKEFKTDVVEKNYNPKWKQKWTKNLKRFSALPRIEFELWDRDSATKDDYGGVAVLELGKMGFSGTQPLVKASLPIALQPKLKPSGKAAQASLVVTVALMPDYHFAANALRESGRSWEGDGKRLTVALDDDLGVGTKLIVEFEGQKCDFFLVQTEEADSEHVWTELAFLPDATGHSPGYKIRREALRAGDEDTWKLKGHRVETAKKMDDLDIWTPWNRLVLRSFRYEAVLSKTQADVHTERLNPGVDPTVPVTYEEVKGQVHDVLFDDHDDALYYAIPEPLSTGRSLALLSSTFGSKTFDRAMWLLQTAHAQHYFVDLSYEERRKRTEVHFRHPKEVLGFPCAMRVSVDDLKPPCQRSKMHVRILRKDVDSIKQLTLDQVLPGVFVTYPKIKKAKVDAHGNINSKK